MQKLHQKLKTKYRLYHNWHQMLGVIIGFGFMFCSASVSFAADSTAPTIPTNLTATPVSSSQINLSWTASTDDVGVTGYKIYRCAGSGCAPTAQIATSATNSYSDTGLTASTAYTYVVSAYDAAGNDSAQSVPAQATPFPSFAADTITGECNSNWQTQHPEWLFCDDFEGGAFKNGWNLIWTTTDINLVTAPTDSVILTTPASRSGNVARIHYYINSPTPAHQDYNRFLAYSIATPLDHVFVRGYVLIPKNTALWGATKSIQRKLIYFKSNNWASPSSGFGFMLTSDLNSPTDNYATLRLGYGGVGGTNASIWNIGQIEKGVWIAIEIEVILNQIGVSDGVFRLWKNDVMIFERTNLDLRSPNGNNSLYKIGLIEVGRQIDRVNGDIVDEYRYWDDVVISSSRIYSGSQTDTTPPSTPTNLSAIAISSSQIDLTWTASTDDVGVIGYKIYRCAGSACTPTVQIATLTTNSYSNIGLTASTAYTYAVSAYDAAGNESEKSTSRDATTPSQFKPSDLNQDQKVNSLDFEIFKSDYNRTDKPKSDLNQDGIVDTRDLGIMMGEWGG